MNDVFNYLHLPQEVKIEESNDSYGRFSFEPLNEGNAITIGNAFRRVLLSSIPGIAIVGVKIDGVEHEFSTIDGVKEDVLNIILNLKQVRFKALNEEFKTGEVAIHRSEPGVVLAKDIELPANLVIADGDIYITELMDNASMDMTIYLEKGIGYRQSNIDMSDKDIGYIFVDALFSPIKRVEYKVEKSILKDYYDFERLVLSIETDSTIKAVDSLNQASQILMNYVSVFSKNFKEAQQEVAVVEKEEVMNENLFKTIDELELNVRASNCLRSHGIRYIWQLVQKNDTELLNTKNFGKQSLKEIKTALKQLGLDLNTQLSDEDIAKIQAVIEKGSEEQK